MSKYGFYPYSEDKPNVYTEDDVGLLFDGFVTDGAYRYVGNCFKVAPADDKSKKIKIGTGQVWLDHVYTRNLSSLIIDLSKIKAPTCDVVIMIDKTLKKNQIQVITGSYESTSEISYYRLATVKITDKPNITEDDITNYVGTETFPYVKSMLLGDDFKCDMQVYVNEKLDEAKTALEIFTDEQITEATKTLTTYTNLKINEATKTLTTYTNLQIGEATKTLTSFTNLQIGEATKTLTTFTNLKVEEAKKDLESAQIGIDNDTIQKNDKDQIWVPKLPTILTDVENLKTDFSSFESAKSEIVSSALGQSLELTETSTITEVANAINEYAPSSGKPEWENTSNGSYKFLQNGQRWVANNRGISSSVATSTWKVIVKEPTTAYIGYRTASDSSDKLNISLNGTSILSNASEIMTSESTLTLNLIAGENTLTATFNMESSSNVHGDLAYVILPAIGDQPGQYKYQLKSITPSSSIQTIYPDNGFDGLYSIGVDRIPEGLIVDDWKVKAGMVNIGDGSSITIETGLSDIKIFMCVNPKKEVFAYNTSKIKGYDGVASTAYLKEACISGHGTFHWAYDQAIFSGISGPEYKDIDSYYADGDGYIIGDNDLPKKNYITNITSKGAVTINKLVTINDSSGFNVDTVVSLYWVAFGT